MRTEPPRGKVAENLALTEGTPVSSWSGSGWWTARSWGTRSATFRSPSARALRPTRSRTSRWVPAVRRHLGEVAHAAELRVTASAARRKEARLLGVKVGAAVLSPPNTPGTSILKGPASTASPSSEATATNVGGFLSAPQAQPRSERAAQKEQEGYALIDLTMELEDNLSPTRRTRAAWCWNSPNTPHARASRLRPGFASRVLMFSDHIGTHVDSPFHFIPTAGTIESVPLEQFIGPRCV